MSFVEQDRVMREAARLRRIVPFRTALFAAIIGWLYGTMLVALMKCGKVPD